MNWLKAKRLIRRKPYLLDPYRCRSAEEAQKILDEEGILSPDALLSAARVRAGMSEAEWEAYTGISSEEMRRKIERLTPLSYLLCSWPALLLVVRWQLRHITP